MGSLVFQLGISAPLVLAVIVYTATRPDKGLLQHYLLSLLLLTFAWMIGMALQASPDAQVRLAGNFLAYPPAALMSPVFCIMMLLYARVERFESNRGARWSVLAPFWLFLAAFLTDDWHGQMGASIPAPDGSTKPHGSLFWGFQICSNVTALVGLSTCVWLARCSPSANERRRMWLLCAGAFLPLVVHLLFTTQVLPFDYPLTSSSMGVTALIVVAAIRRYRLLEVQPVARRDVIEASRDAVIIADADECLVDLNPTAESLMDAERTALAGRPLASVLADLDSKGSADVFSQMLGAIRRGETPPVFEVEDPAGRILEVSGGTARGAAGATAGYFVVLRDRTAERRGERLLQRTQRLESVGLLAAGVAHEVNNPLAFVRSNLAHVRQVAGVLDARADELPKEVSEEASDLVDVIDESITGLDRIEKIVRGLLGLSRTASEQVERCDVNEIVREAARFASLDGEAEIHLETRLAVDLPAVRASSDQLVQVLLNLFLNARNALHGRADARIVASTSTHGDLVEIRISDNGPGIPESIQGRIFDPFFTTRPPNEGTGLGLSIGFDIVREHGGALEVEKSESGGACFLVQLPADASSTADT